jgi:hypothetical protein
MARIALCISGQPRKALETYPFIQKYIIEPNNADVFIHMNYDSNMKYIEKGHLDNGICKYPENIDSKVLDLYKPVRYLIESPKSLLNPNIDVADSRVDAYLRMNKHRNMTKDEMKYHMTKQLLSMFYSIYKCNELKEIFANENGFVYDYVIRLRFDACPSKPLICSRYSPNFIYYQDLGQPDNLISDWFNFGSNSIMNIYASLYLHSEYLNTFQYFKQSDRLPNTIEKSDTCSGINEFMVRDIMTLFKIPKAHIDIGLKLIY